MSEWIFRLPSLYEYFITLLPIIWSKMTNRWRCVCAFTFRNCSLVSDFHCVQHWRTEVKLIFLKASIVLLSNSATAIIAIAEGPEGREDVTSTKPTSFLSMFNQTIRLNWVWNVHMHIFVDSFYRQDSFDFSLFFICLCFYDWLLFRFMPVIFVLRSSSMRLSCRSLFLISTTSNVLSTEKESDRATEETRTRHKNALRYTFRLVMR